MIEYALFAKNRLEEYSSLFNHYFNDYNNFGEEDGELQTELLDFKWEVERKGLFAYETGNPIDGQLEVAQEHIENETLTKPIAWMVLAMMSKAIHRFDAHIYSVHGCYHCIVREKKQLSLEQHEKLKYIYCKKFVELSECLGQLCDFIKAEAERQEQSAVEGSVQPG